MDFEKLLLENLNITLNETQKQQFEIYYQELIKWNEVMNLTAIKEKEDVYLKHFYDSITLSKIIKNENVTLCDIGAGAGFPSIPLKICYPNIKVTIVDALAKRINFLNELTRKLNISDVKLIHDRAEEFCKKNREQFDFVTARAVARLNVLAEITIPLVKITGSFISMKADYLEELNEAKKAIEILGASVFEVKTFKLPFEESNRSLINIKKIKETNKKYPRQFNLIKKNPL